jgi:hypothetical protein
MDQTLLRNYLATVYELPTASGPLRVSLDADLEPSPAGLPDLLNQPFALVTAYNPRSMLLPRKVNDGRHAVMRDLLVLGCYRVEQCVGFEEEPDGVWREPAWLVHGMDREEAVAFGRVFRQNTVVVCRNSRPELVVTDPTCDEIGKGFMANWRVRS